MYKPQFFTFMLGKGDKYRYCIDIGKGDINPPVNGTNQSTTVKPACINEVIIFNRHPVSLQGFWASGEHGVCIHEIKERNQWNFYINITNWKTELTRYTTVIANLWLEQENVRCSLPVNHGQLEIYMLIETVSNWHTCTISRWHMPQCLIAGVSGDIGCNYIIIV